METNYEKLKRIFTQIKSFKVFSNLKRQLVFELSMWELSNGIQKERTPEEIKEETKKGLKLYNKIFTKKGKVRKTAIASDSIYSLSIK